jgi:hypothetical protein
LGPTILFMPLQQFVFVVAALLLQPVFFPHELLVVPGVLPSFALPLPWPFYVLGVVLLTLWPHSFHDSTYEQGYETTTTKTEKTHLSTYAHIICIWQPFLPMLCEKTRTLLVAI